MGCSQAIIHPFAPERNNAMRRYALLWSAGLLLVAGCGSEDSHVSAVKKLGGLVVMNKDPGRENGIGDKVQAVRLVSKPQLTDDDLKHLEGFTDMENLELFQTPITDKGLEHLKGLVNLQMLVLSDTKITDAGLANLENMKKLKTLRLSRDNITDAGLDRLKMLPSLAELDLVGTQVTQDAADTFAKEKGVTVHTDKNPFRGGGGRGMGGQGMGGRGRGGRGRGGPGGRGGRGGSDASQPAAPPRGGPETKPAPNPDKKP
jgi:hypothetical protein